MRLSKRLFVQCFALPFVLLAGAATADDLPEISPGEPLSFDEALRLADERNASLAATRIDLLSARAGLKRAWAPLMPTVQGTMTMIHNDHEDKVNVGGGGEIIIGRQNTLRGGLQASMPVINGELWSNVSAGRLGLDVAGLTVENVRQELLATVARAFYQALTAKALIDVQVTLLETARRHVEVATTRHVSGVGSRLDVIRARSDVVRLRQDLISAHAAYENARDTLGLLTGKGGLPVPVEGPALSVPSGTSEDLVERAGRERPDLKLSKKSMELSERQLDTSWMQFLPTLAASWQLTHQFTSPSAFGSQDRTRWNALMTLTVPFYSQSRYADLDDKRARALKVKLQAEDQALQAELEVRVAMRGYETSLEQLQAAQEKAALSREALTLAETAYASGTGTSLDVTDASRTGRQDEVTLAIRRFAVQLELLNLLQAVGEDMGKIGG